MWSVARQPSGPSQFWSSARISGGEGCGLPLGTAPHAARPGLLAAQQLLHQPQVQVQIGGSVLRPLVPAHAEGPVGGSAHQAHGVLVPAVEGGGLLHPGPWGLSIFLGGDQITGAGYAQVSQGLADVPGQEAPAAHKGLELPGEVGQPLEGSPGAGVQLVQGEGGPALPEGLKVQVLRVDPQLILAEGGHAVPVGDAVDLFQVLPGLLPVLPAQAVGDGGEVGLPGVLQRGQAGDLAQGGRPRQEDGEGLRRAARWGAGRGPGRGSAEIVKWDR